MTIPLSVESDIHFKRRGRGSRRVMETGPNPTLERPAGRLPRISRLMAMCQTMQNWPVWAK